MVISNPTKQGEYFFDRDYDYFPIILSLLRSSKEIPWKKIQDLQSFVDEVDFYQIIIEKIDDIMKIEEIKKNKEKKEDIDSKKIEKIKNGTLPKWEGGFFKESTLLDESQQTQLIEWLGRKCDFKLLYKATKDGFSAGKFHELCDNKGETFIVIKSINGNIFGGYAGESWKNSSVWISSSTSFLFSFVNSQKKTLKFPVRSICAQYAQLGTRYNYFIYQVIRLYLVVEMVEMIYISVIIVTLSIILILISDSPMTSQAQIKSLARMVQITSSQVPINSPHWKLKFLENKNKI